VTPGDVLDYWFDPENRRAWFRSTPEQDRHLRARFAAYWIAARGGRLAAWEDNAPGALALVIVLDQLPLNMFRGQARSFSTGQQALQVAEAAIRRGFDAAFDAPRKTFLYLPFMHSESLSDQDRSVALFEAAGLPDNLRWARHHRAIIRRFGRFPHRNRVLGRESTREESAWLASVEGFNG
jgi:uncharacterized protein (DUF924 family)